MKLQEVLSYRRDQDITVLFSYDLKDQEVNFLQDEHVSNQSQVESVKISDKVLQTGTSSIVRLNWIILMFLHFPIKYFSAETKEDVII